MAYIMNQRKKFALMFLKAKNNQSENDLNLSFTQFYSIAIDYFILYSPTVNKSHENLIHPL